MKKANISFEELFSDKEISITAKQISTDDGTTVFAVTAKVEGKEFFFKRIAGFRLKGDVLSDAEIEELGPENLAIRRVKTLFQLLHNVMNLFSQFDIAITGNLEQKEVVEKKEEPKAPKK